MTYPKSLLHVATDRRVVELIVRARMTLRRFRRDKLFFDRLAVTGQNYAQAGDKILQDLLPPRREWPRPSLSSRKRALERGGDAIAELMVKHIMRKWSEPNQHAPAWLQELRRFSARIRRRLRHWDTDDLLVPSRIIPQLKKRGEAPDEPDQYRCLAVYSLEDKLIISLTAEYLRKLTDSVMHLGSLAFRVARDGNPPPNHHTAAKKIIEFRHQKLDGRKKNIWISEVDIRGFFDAVSHDIARKSVSRLLDRLHASVVVDQRALAILDSYLDGYSFNVLARSKAYDALRSGRRHREAEIPWPEEALKKLGCRVESDPIGIPQGGALSCFLANAILDEADWKVESSAMTDPKGASLYLRYCDDIIILARSRRLATRMLKGYLASLQSLKLPCHEPNRFDRVYGAIPESHTSHGFWACKSKTPYAWAAKGKPGRVPWCSFVGYQIRYDGVVRVRPSSIQKEKTKQNEVAKRAIEGVRKQGQERTRNQIVYRLRQRLRSMAVGTSRLDLGHARAPFCWAGGFRLLEDHIVVATQLRELDRNRNRNLTRVHRLLQQGTGQRGGATSSTGWHLLFEGYPFSYGAIPRQSKGS